jgi:uncharacterized protein (TIGR00730 family)
MGAQKPGISRRVVTVFGSSRVGRDDPEYEAARRLGALIAQHGWTLCNGGHDGTMEAAARGAKEAGGSTIGVSLAIYRPETRNVWLDQEIVAESLFARLEQLVTLGSAYVVLRGGIGTLLEMCLVWNLVQSPEFTGKPIVLIGEAWRKLVEAFKENLPMHPWEAESIVVVDSVDEAVARLAAYFEQRPKLPEARRASG